MSKILEAIYSESWAITPAALEAIVGIAGRFETMEPEMIRQVMHGKGATEIPQAILGRAGKPIADYARTQIRDGVAVVPIMGPIFPRANLMTAVSGATSIEMLSKEFQMAVDNPDVSAIILNIDSPGGAVTGVSEMADMIYQARQKKPVKAFVYGMGASAAYWLASAADEIIASETAELGSIGVVSAYTDTTTKDDRDGIKKIEIVSSISPLKRVGVNTDEGRAKIQRIVDSVASVFVGNLAKFRGTDEETVLEDFGRGDLFIGARALAQGLIDRIGTMKSVMAECETGKTKKRKEPMMAESEVTMTAEAVRESSPEAYQEILNEGVKRERERLQGIESIKVPGAEKIIAEHKFNPEMDKGKISALILEDQEKRRSEAAAKAAKDAADLAAASAALGAVAPATSEAQEQDKAREQAASTMAKAMNRKRGIK